MEMPENQVTAGNTTQKKPSFPRKTSEKVDSACCWCGTSIKAHKVGEKVSLTLSERSGTLQDEILAREYCPNCDNINLLVELPKDY